MTAPTILIVDDDEVLSQVLRRVLTRQGYTVVEAGNVAQALQLARENPIQLGLLDLRLPDGDGTELARRLREQGADFPLILVTAYPLRLRDRPDLAAAFVRVLTKPLNLQELRQAIDAALAPAPAPAAQAPAGPAEAAAPPDRPPEDHPPAAPPPPVGPAPPPRRSWAPLLVGAAVAAALVGLAFALPLFGLPGPADWFKAHLVETVALGADEQTPSAQPVPGDDNGLVLPASVADHVGIKTQVVHAPTEKRKLHLSGTLNLDANALSRVHARFGGEVIEIGPYKPAKASEADGRPLRAGDPVEKDALLAVVWSKDLGEKKSELVDAIVKRKVDEESLQKLEELYKNLATSEAAVRLQRAQVASDYNAEAKAERTLSVWRVPPEEIEEVRKEAEHVLERKGAHDIAKEKNWARVEVKAAFPGTVVEKNVARGDIVDTSTELFKVADLTRLAVWAHAYEEDLPDLLRLLKAKGRIPWTVTVTADRAEQELKSDGADNVGAIIDPNQHTALATGLADNSDLQLRAGQFVTAAVDLPAPEDVVAVPNAGVVEDGAESAVFVRTDPKKFQFSLRRVPVVQRLADVTYVRTRLTDQDKGRKLDALKDGDEVVVQGAVLLRSALDDVQSRKKAEEKDKK
jgi:cobalt-zinc-cadmium efflux system membrane fusion protein